MKKRNIEELEEIFDIDGGINGEQYRADCPECGSGLEWDGDAIRCDGCKIEWEKHEKIFIPACTGNPPEIPQNDPDGWVLTRQQAFELGVMSCCSTCCCQELATQKVDDLYFCEDHVPGNETDVYSGYVRAESGSIFVQLPSENSDYGFMIHDDDQSWDGGIGLGSWEAIDEEDVDQETKERLGWLLEE